MTKIIADCCSNHLGDRRLMEQMIMKAAEIGIDYVKFQSFKADKLTKDWPDYEKAYVYYKSVELSEADHAFILHKCKEHGIKPLFTAFDIDSAKMLKTLGIDIVKIASPDADNRKIVNYCLGNFDKIIASSGMLDNIDINILLSTDDVSLLYCISKYPTDYDEIDFDKMQMFDGFSDHTIGLDAAKKAIDLGMGYVERHYTLGKHLPGNDHFLSSTPDEFKKLVGHRNYIEKCELYKRRWTNE